MVGPPKVACGEVWLIDLDPTVGSAIQKTRPCVVVSPRDMHLHVRTVLIPPMTSGARPAPFRVTTTFAGRQGRILLDQIRTVDKSRLIRKLGLIDAETLDTTLATLQTIFAE